MVCPFKLLIRILTILDQVMNVCLREIFKKRNTQFYVASLFPNPKPINIVFGTKIALFFPIDQHELIKTYPCEILAFSFMVWKLDYILNNHLRQCAVWQITQLHQVTSFTVNVVSSTLFECQALENVTNESMYMWRSSVSCT